VSVRRKDLDAEGKVLEQGARALVEGPRPFRGAAKFCSVAFSIVTIGARIVLMCVFAGWVSVKRFCCGGVVVEYPFLSATRKPLAPTRLVRVRGRKGIGKNLLASYKGCSLGRTVIPRDSRTCCAAPRSTAASAWLELPAQRI
jgi:hypothetical protein